MIAVITRHELRRLSRDGRTHLSAALVLALLLLALLTSLLQQRSLVAAQQAAQAEERGRWLHQPEKNPHSAAHYGVYVFKPRLGLGFLDTGIEPYAGSALWLEAHKQNEVLHRPADDASPAGRYGELTCALILQVFAPLLVLLLCFGAFASEREHGTLQQLLSVGVSSRQLLIGKLLGHVAALVVLLLPLVVLTSLLLAWLQAGLLAHEGPRLLCFLAVYCIFVLIFALVALGISARTSTSRHALAWLLALWTAGCMLAPRLMAELAASLYPTPPAVAIRRTLETRLGDPHEPQRAALVARLLQQYGVANTKDLPINRSGLELQAGEEHGNQVFDEVLGSLFDRYERQAQVLQKSATLVPFLSLHALSQALAGTDLYHHRQFVQQAEQHRRLIQRLMNGHVMSQRDPDAAFSYTAGRELWQQVPAFTFQPPTLQAVLMQQWRSLGLLGLWLLAALGFAWRGVHHLRPNQGDPHVDRKAR